MDSMRCPNDERIDWILTHGKVAVDKSEIVTLSKDGQFPSDHCPLVVWLRRQEWRQLSLVAPIGSKW